MFGGRGLSAAVCTAGNAAPRSRAVGAPAKGRLSAGAGESGFADPRAGAPGGAPARRAAAALPRSAT